MAHQVLFHSTYGRKVIKEPKGGYRSLPDRELVHQVFTLKNPDAQYELKRRIKRGKHILLPNGGVKTHYPDKQGVGGKVVYAPIPGSDVD